MLDEKLGFRGREAMMKGAAWSLGTRERVASLNATEDVCRDSVGRRSAPLTRPGEEFSVYPWGAILAIGSVMSNETYGAACLVAGRESSDNA